MRIRELPVRERPAQRLHQRGSACLSDAELLALVSGQQDLVICERSLQEYHGWVGLLRADLRSLAGSLGTPRRAATLKAALEIGRRLAIASYDDRFQVKSPPTWPNSSWPR